MYSGFGEVKPFAHEKGPDVMRHDKPPEIDARIIEVLDLLDAAANAALDAHAEAINEMQEQRVYVREDAIPNILNNNVAEDYEKILRMVKGYAALIGCRATVTNNFPQGSSQETLDPEAQLARLLMALSTAGDELAEIVEKKRTPRGSRHGALCSHTNLTTT